MFLHKPFMVGINQAQYEYNLIHILLHATSNVHPCVSVANNMLMYSGRLSVHNNNNSNANVLNIKTLIIIYFY